MRRSIIFARRITSGKDGSPIGWDGVDDFSAWYVKNKSATSEKGILKLYITNAIDRTAGRLNGLLVKLEGLAGSELWGARAGNVCLRLSPTAKLSGPGLINCGLHVEAYGANTIAGDFYGAYIYSAPNAVTGGESAVLRLESNVTADDRNHEWLAVVGGYGEHLMALGPLAFQTAWNYLGSPSNQVGWLKIRIASFDRWIMLYDTAP